MITLGILIVFAVGAIIYKATDLMVKKAEKREKLALEQANEPVLKPMAQGNKSLPEDFDIILGMEERILEASFGGRAYLIRIGERGITKRILILSTEGKMINEITVKHQNENPDTHP